MKDFWYGILGQSRSAMWKVDEATVEALEQTAPGAIEKEARILHGKLQSGQIFGAFDEGQRQIIWKEVMERSTDRLIPSFSGFFEDLNWLKGPIDTMRRLIELSPRQTIFTALQDMFSESIQERADCIIQITEDSFNSRPGTVSARLDLGIRQLLLFAIRHHLEIPPLSGKKNLLARVMPPSTNQRALRMFANLAHHTGFESDGIRHLCNLSLTSNQPSPPAFSQPDSDREPKRCGIPFLKHFEEEKSFLFLGKIYGAENSDQDDITPFFIRRSVLFLFLGKPADEYVQLVLEAQTQTDGQNIDQSEATHGSHETHQRRFRRNDRENKRRRLKYTRVRDRPAPTVPGSHGQAEYNHNIREAAEQRDRERDVSINLDVHHVAERGNSQGSNDPQRPDEILEEMYNTTEPEHIGDQGLSQSFTSLQNIQYTEEPLASMSQDRGGVTWTVVEDPTESAEAHQLDEAQLFEDDFSDREQQTYVTTSLQNQEGVHLQATSNLRVPPESPTLSAILESYHDSEGIAQGQTRQQQALEEQARQQQALEEHARQQQALEEQARQQQALEEHARQQQALEEQARQQQALEEQARQQQALEEQARQQQALEEQARQQQALEEHARQQQAIQGQSETHLPRDPDRSFKSQSRSSQITQLNMAEIVGDGKRRNPNDGESSSGNALGSEGSIKDDERLQEHPKRGKHRIDDRGGEGDDSMDAGFSGYVEAQKVWRSQQREFNTDVLASLSSGAPKYPSNPLKRPMQEGPQLWRPVIGDEAAQGLENLRSTQRDLTRRAETARLESQAPASSEAQEQSRRLKRPIQEMVPPQHSRFGGLRVSEDPESDPAESGLVTLRLFVKHNNRDEWYFLRPVKIDPRDPKNFDALLQKFRNEGFHAFIGSRMLTSSTPFEDVVASGDDRVYLTKEVRIGM